MKNKRLLFWLVLMVFAGILVGPFANSAPVEKPIELNLVTIHAAVANSHLCHEYYANKISERTNGRVKITIYPTGILTAPTKNFEAIKIGMADMGVHCAAYTPGAFPASEATFLPLPVSNAWALSHTVSDFYSHFTLKELADMRSFYSATTGPYLIATIDKPVLKPKDMKGLQMRAIGSAVDLVKQWGGTPVSMPMGEVYEALSKRVIDGGILPLEAIASFKLGDSLKYATIAPVGVTFPGFIVMNLKKWNGLPKDIQEVFIKTNEDMKDWYAQTWQYADLEGVKYFLGLPGRKFLDIPASDKEDWLKLAAPVTDTFIAKATKMGLPAGDYVKYLIERVEYWNKRYPGDEKITEWVEKEIKKAK